MEEVGCVVRGGGAGGIAGGRAFGAGGLRCEYSTTLWAGELS